MITLGGSIVRREKIELLFFTLLPGSAIAILSVWFVESFNKSRTTTYFLVSLLGVVAFLPAINRLVKHRLDLPEPAIWFAAFYFVAFGVRAIYDLTFGSGWLRFGPDVEDLRLVNSALSVSILALLCFWFGYNLRFGKIMARVLPILPKKWSKNCLIPVVLFCTCIAWILRLYIINSYSGSIIEWLLSDKDIIFRLAPGSFTYIRIIYLNLGASAIVILFIAGRLTHRRRYKLLFWALLIPEILFLLLEGKRLFVPALLLSILISYYMTSKRGHHISCRLVLYAVLVLMLGVLLYPIISIVRFKGVSAIRKFPYQYLTPKELFKNVSGNLHSFDSLALIMRDVPEKVPYTYGSEILRMRYACIPKRLWPEKPVINPGDIFRDTFAPAEMVSEGVSVCVSLPGQFYWDLGIPGILIGMPLIGIIFRFWYEYMVRKKGNLSNVLVVSVMFVWCFFTVKHTLVNYTAYLFAFLLLSSVTLVLGSRQGYLLSLNKE